MLIYGTECFISHSEGGRVQQNKVHQIELSTSTSKNFHENNALHLQ